MIISVDGGTTNTRLSLIENGEILSTVKIRIGAANPAASSAENPYPAALRDGLQDLLRRTERSECDVEAMIYSGMIGSENGLYTVPYLLAPANAEQLARAMEEVSIPQILDVPMFFVPGLRTAGASVFETNVMRGEETELIGIYKQLGLENFIAVMPGSHTKIVRIEQGGTIGCFHTAMTGELIRAAAEHTILKSALYDVFPKRLDEKFLVEGFGSCDANGINQSLFEVRIRQKFAEQTPEQLFSFLCGVCMHADIAPILQASNGLPIYVGGSDPFRSAYAHLLRTNGAERVFEISDSVAEHAAAYGAQWLMELRRTPNESETIS